MHHRDCSASQDPEHHVHSILAWAQKANKGSGFVTTSRVTHATPAALYAHSPDRRWECDGHLLLNPNRACKDIARQLVEDEPGRSLNVIMGGGRQCLISNVTGIPEDPVDTYSCYSTDKRNLITKWANEKADRFRAVVLNNDQLEKVNTNETDYLMGEWLS